MQASPGQEWICSGTETSSNDVAIASRINFYNGTGVLVPYGRVAQACDVVGARFQTCLGEKQYVYADLSGMQLSSSRTVTAEPGQAISVAINSMAPGSLLASTRPRDVDLCLST